MKSTRRGSFSVHRSEKTPRFQIQRDKRPLSPGTSREAGGVPCLHVSPVTAPFPELAHCFRSVSEKLLKAQPCPPGLFSASTTINSPKTQIQITRRTESRGLPQGPYGVWRGKESRMNPGLPWRCSGQESACQRRGHAFDPRSRKIPRALEQQSPCTTTTELTWGNHLSRLT